MKKMLVVLLILSVAGGMFAADVGEGFTITGEVKSGFGVFSQDDELDNGDDTYIQAWNDDAGSIHRVRVNLQWEGDVGGTKIRFQSSGGSTDVILHQAYGWLNLLDKKIVLWGGHNLAYLFNTGGVQDAWFDSGDLVRLEVRPIDGLSIAANVPVPLGGQDVSGFSTNNQMSLGNTFGALGFGAKYSNDTFTALAYFKLNPGAKGTYFGVTGDTDGDGIREPLGKVEVPSANEVDGFVEAVYAIQVPSILPVGIDITGSFKSGDNGHFRVAPKLTYAADKFDAHVQGDINMDISSDTAAPDSDLANFGAREEDDASIGFELGVGYAISDIIGLYLNLGSKNIGYLDGNGLYAKPGATFAFGPNTSIEVFDKISLLGADSKIAGNIHNQFQVEFVWSF
jgi:hypothetical protein